MVWIAFTAAVSRMYICVRLYFGTAIVMMIRMIAITISSSISEKPRRRLLRLSICLNLSFYDGRKGRNVHRQLLAKGLFERGNLGQAAAVAVGTGKPGRQIVAHQKDGQFRADDTRTKT